MCVCVCESVAVWCGKCGIVGVWKSGSVEEWEGASLGVWECGSLGVYLIRPI